MNEIDKLKTENTRYKKALKTIHDQYPVCTDAYGYADAALNPPPPTPVTLDELCSALKTLNTAKGKNALHSITFFSDASGDILNDDDSVLHSFYSFREALDKLKEKL